jgi:Holliday junction resolvasome RuvABC endonuclease subunit
MIILGCDPSKRATGLAVLDEWQLIYWEVVSNPSEVDFVEAGMVAAKVARRVYNDYHPQTVGVEMGVVGPNQRLSINHSMLIGAFLATCHFPSRKLWVVNPQDTKVALCPKGKKRDKDEMVAAACRRVAGFPSGQSQTIREAIADACGVAHAARLLAGSR